MATDGGYQKFFKEARKNSGLSEQPTVRARALAGAKAKPNAKHASKPNRGLGKASSRLQSNDTPEDRLRAELARRMKNKRASHQRRRARFPVIPAIVAIATFLIGGLAYYNGDYVEALMTKSFGRIEIGVFGSASAAEEAKADKNQKPPSQTEEKSAATKGEKEAHSAESSANTKLADVPNTKQWTPEELSFFGKLNERKQQLDLREAELNRLEEELQKRKLELDSKLKQLEAMRTDISKTLKTRVASDQEKVEKLVQVYSSMKPQQASKVIESLDEDLAVEILDKMKKKSAAEVLNMMDAKKARKLSELLTGYERSPSSEDDVETSASDEANHAAAPAKTEPNTEKKK